MPRTPPTLPVPQPDLKPPDGFILTLRTITPMFGGSATTREVDPHQPVRAASVRGHLRFWWRATAGASQPTQLELFKAESEIWGNTERHGQVRIEVEMLEQGHETQPVRHNRRSNGKMGFDYGSFPAYALFPFQGAIKYGVTDEEPNRARENIDFRLTVTCPPRYRNEVQQAVAAWVMFGGIGSRTRRGCGSLALEAGTLPPVQGVGVGPDLLTTLPGAYFLGQPQRDSVRAWAEAVAVYRDFRQGVGFARNPGQQANRPGRSRYPEPDTLRDITRRYGHQVIHPVRGFPRANLGLPIIFHFQGLEEPSDQTLQGSVQGQQRFASPVITKVAQVDGEFVPLVMVLNSPNVWAQPVELKGQRPVSAGEINLPADDLKKISPQNGLPIRDALKKFVQDNGFRAVRL